MGTHIAIGAGNRAATDVADRRRMIPAMVLSGGAGGQGAEPAEGASPGDDAAAPPLGVGALDICPYLVDASGAWRRAQPSRTHRCGARTPAPTIPALTQKRICLAAEHRSCEFFVAAVGSRDEALLADHVRRDRVESSRFQIASRPLPLAADGVQDGTLPPPSITGTGGRRWLPVAAALLAVGGLSLLAAVMFMSGRPSGIAAVPSTPVGTPATPNPTDGLPSRPAPTGLPSVAPSGTPPPTAPPSAQPTPDGTPPEPGPRRYRVRQGDTLNRIASRFDTTVRGIRAANDLGDNEDIRVGQVLRIP
jgi:nucleoid-associated protein YgaU